MLTCNLTFSFSANFQVHFVNFHINKSVFLGTKICLQTNEYARQQLCFL